MKVERSSQANHVILSTVIYYLQDGTKSRLQRLRDERGGQDERFFKPKYMYVNRFADKDANKVNWLDSGSVHTL